ncbi:MAG: glycosyl transferase [Sphingobium sp. 66-54]|nr:MAG: glycosyl transferase [Sphingobium sp. 66-54]
MASTVPLPDGARVGLVAIGRNEGERLKRCLRSVPAGCPVVYVDSGSTDDSVAFARSLGMTVEPLAAPNGFTAALARNAGWRRLLELHPSLAFVQFVDGDCELDPAWLPRALAEIEGEAGLCAVFGRRRERFPQATLYNALCDDEWNVPVGYVEACGGDVLFRVAALRQANGYTDDLIAGEEPDLCLRLGREGWKIRRIDAEMTRHDADIRTFRQNWLRVRRSGHAYAEHVARHGDAAFPDWRRQLRSIVLWALFIPALITGVALMALATGWTDLWLVAALGLLVYPAQVVRLARRKARMGANRRFACFYGFWMVIGKFAQAGGVLRFHWNRRRGGTHRIIEYKR